MASTTAEARWLRRNRGYLIAAALAAAGGYGAYKLYNSRSLSDTQSALVQAARTLGKLSGAASASSDMLALLADDLRDYLASDSDEVPRSLRQLAKIAQCDDVQECLRACVASSVAGATAPAAARPGAPAEPGAVDKIIAAFLSDRGRSLVGLAISVATRDSTTVFCEQLRAAVETALGPESSRGGAAAGASVGAFALSALQHLLSLLSSEEGEGLLRTLVCSSVGTAVVSYMDNAQQYDMTGPFLDALARPDHARALTDMMAGVAAAATREMVASVFEASALQQQQQGQQATVVEEGSDDQQQQQQPQWQQTETVQANGELHATSGAKCSHPAPAGEASSSSITSSRQDAGSEASTPQSWPSTPDVHATPTRRAQAANATPNTALGMLSGGLFRRRPSTQQQPPSAASGRCVSTLHSSTEQQGFGWGTAMRLMAQAAQVQELRSLAMEVSASSTREFLRALLHPGSLLQGGQNGQGHLLQDGAAAALHVHMMRLYVLVFVLMALCVYAISPRLFGGSVA